MSFNLLRVYPPDNVPEAQMFVLADPRACIDDATLCGIIPVSKVFVLPPHSPGNDGNGRLKYPAPQGVCNAVQSERMSIVLTSYRQS